MQSGAFIPSAARNGHADDVGRGNSPPRTWVAQPPPFGVSADRFNREGRSGSPEYHAAYRDVVQPPRWTAKGWVGMDDYVKPRRGTAPSVYGTSSLVPPTAPPRHAAGLAPLAPPVPNEVRLQELLGLQRRKLHTEPGPGAYEPRVTSQRRRFRRQHDPTLDGPLFLEHMADGTSTRVKEIAALIKAQGDSGLGPGEYDGLLNKDRVMRSAPAARVGTADREGRSQHAKSLSISRSIQHGIDWHVPVIVQPSPAAAAALAAAAASGSGAGAAAAGEGDAAAAASTTPRAEPSAALARNQSVSGSVGGGGGGSRDTSPSGRPSAAEQYLGAPPPPPSQVSRAVRRQQERRPGDWDWNRLNKNYRTTWTTLHGGAYSHGEHPIPKPPYAGGAGVGGGLAGGGSGLGGMGGGSHSSPAIDPHAVQGIYPIAEESSGALEANSSMGSVAQQQQQQYQQQLQYQYQQQQLLLQQQHQASGDGGGGGLPGQVAGGYPGQGAQGDGYGAGSSLPGGGLPPVGVSGPAHMSLQPGQKIKPLISEEDLRRRRAAIALAQQAQQANNRVTDWQTKFAG